MVRRVVHFVRLDIVARLFPRGPRHCANANRRGVRLQRVLQRLRDSGRRVQDGGLERGASPGVRRCSNAPGRGCTTAVGNALQFHLRPPLPGLPLSAGGPSCQPHESNPVQIQRDITSQGGYRCRVPRVPCSRPRLHAGAPPSRRLAAGSLRGLFRSGRIHLGLRGSRSRKGGCRCALDGARERRAAIRSRHNGGPAQARRVAPAGSGYVRRGSRALALHAPVGREQARTSVRPLRLLRSALLCRDRVDRGRERRPRRLHLRFRSVVHDALGRDPASARQDAQAPGGGTARGTLPASGCPRDRDRRAAGSRRRRGSALARRGHACGRTRVSHEPGGHRPTA